MSTLRYSVVQAEPEAKKLWDIFSPKRVIDEDWDYRYTFFRYHGHKLHFIVGYDGEQPIGLLPLQNNSDLGVLEFFGGKDADDNIIFFKPGYENYAADFLDQIQQPAKLEYMAIAYPYTKQAEVMAMKYYLNMSEYKSFDDHLDRHWYGQSRLKFKRNLRNIFKRHNVEIIDDDYGSIEELFRLNKARFGEESDFHKPHREQMYRDLINLFDCHLTTIVVNGKKEAVAFGILYKGRYVQMNLGINTEINYLGKLVIIQQINRGISLGAKLYDAGRNPMGWKDAFRLYEEPQYRLELPSRKSR